MYKAVNAGAPAANPHKLKQTVEAAKTASETIVTLLKPLTFKGHTDAVSSVALSVDGSLALSGSADHSIRVWSMETGDCLKILKEHSTYITGLSLNPDEEILVSGSHDGSMRVWSLNSGQCLKESKFEKSVCVISPLSKDYYFALGRKNGTIYYLHAYSFLDDSLISLARREKEMDVVRQKAEKFKQESLEEQKKQVELQARLAEQNKEAEQLKHEIAILKSSTADYQKQIEHFKQGMAHQGEKERESKLYIEGLKQKIQTLTEQTQALNLQINSYIVKEKAYERTIADKHSQQKENNLQTFSPAASSISNAKK